jgi:hypothetical protein
LFLTNTTGLFFFYVVETEEYTKKSGHFVIEKFFLRKCSGSAKQSNARGIVAGGSRTQALCFARRQRQSQAQNALAVRAPFWARRQETPPVLLSRPWMKRR